MPNTYTTRNAQATIVVPCYNEEKRLCLQAFLHFAQQHPHIHFLFVNDGSTDQTQSVLEQLHRAQPNQLSVHTLVQNQGKAEAVRQGILHAFSKGSKYIGFWDADLATPLSAIPDFCTKLDQHNELIMVFGSRIRLLGRQIERQPTRHYFGRVFATLVSLMLKLPIYDTQCGAKLFRASPETEALFQARFLSRWIFDVELLARFIQARQQQGQSHTTHNAIYEVPLFEWRDVSGSKVTPTDGIRAFYELSGIYRKYFS
ncbi:MAG: dolichyl-phosphate beta-glucosyltransferase [Myxococcota bacterium]